MEASRWPLLSSNMISVRIDLKAQLVLEQKWLKKLEIDVFVKSKTKTQRCIEFLTGGTKKPLLAPRFFLKVLNIIPWEEHGFIQRYKEKPDNSEE